MASIEKRMEDLETIVYLGISKNTGPPSQNTGPPHYQTYLEKFLATIPYDNITELDTDPPIQTAIFDKLQSAQGKIVRVIVLWQSIRDCFPGLQKKDVNRNLYLLANKGQVGKYSNNEWGLLCNEQNTKQF